MAAEFDTLPVLPGGVTARILQEDLEAITPPRSPLPNHLTQTNVFSRPQTYSPIKTKPEVVNFHGYKVGRLHQKTIHIINTSGDNASLNIVPPITDHFVVDYNKMYSHLVPGLGMKVTLCFRPSEWKQYRDSLRINCKGSNLLIPIHAYPVLDVSSFPRSVVFRPTPVGQSHSHLITFTNGIPVGFEFSLTPLSPHAAFSVSPMNGIVDGNSTCTITVTFSPKEFSTAIMKLKLDVFHYNFKPIICTFTGNAVPGLALQQYKNKQIKQKKVKTSSSKDPTLHHQKPPSTSSNNKEKDRKQPQRDTKPKVIKYEGIHFPDCLDTPSAVAKVLAQKPGVMTAMELKAATQSSATDGDSSYQLKEAKFLQKVKEISEEEKANEIRWGRHLGSDHINKEDTESILKSRSKAHNKYQTNFRLASNEEDSHRSVTVLSKGRTLRKVNEIPHDSFPSFDLLSNNDWEKRHRSLQMFVQAAHKVIIRNRCWKRLKLLCQLIDKVKTNSQTLIEPVIGEDHQLLCDDLVLRLSQPSFPQYVDKKKEQEKLPSTPVTAQSVAVSINPAEPILDLKVPHEHKLLGYNPLTVPQCIYYMPPLPTQQETSFLIGAKEEYIGLSPLPDVDLSFLWRDIKSSGVTKEEEDKEKEEEEIDKDKLREAIEDLLTPPPQLLEPKLDENRWQILNPCPEVVSSLEPMLPNTEVTWEHYLLPLPTGSGAPHPQPRIDPFDGIPGAMKWKEFPSPFLATMEGQKTLSSKWRPCLTDPFSTDLLPYVTDPPQMSGPQPDDLHLLQGSSEPGPTLTDEMIRAEFFIPEETDEPSCTRKQFEVELEEEHQKSLNKLGSQVQQRYSNMLSLLSPKNRNSLRNVL